jgi:CheY-like chemotaxis protein
MSQRPGIGEHRPARILIVDDERHNRQVLEVMLALEGFVIQSAASGEEALAKAAEQPPDLILLDVYQESEPTRASRKGLGLGLYICKELVLRQGGHIWLKSQQHKGSTFSLALPVFALDNAIGAPVGASITSPVLTEVVKQ